MEEKCVNKEENINLKNRRICTEDEWGGGLNKRYIKMKNLQSK